MHSQPLAIQTVRSLAEIPSPSPVELRETYALCAVLSTTALSSSIQIVKPTLSTSQRHQKRDHLYQTQSRRSLECPKASFRDSSHGIMGMRESKQWFCVVLPLSFKLPALSLVIPKIPGQVRARLLGPSCSDILADPSESEHGQGWGLLVRCTGVFLCNCEDTSDPPDPCTLGHLPEVALQDLPIPGQQACLTLQNKGGPELGVPGDGSEADWFCGSLTSTVPTHKDHNHSPRCKVSPILQIQPRSG